MKVLKNYLMSYTIIADMIARGPHSDAVVQKKSAAFIKKMNERRASLTPEYIERLQKEAIQEVLNVCYRNQYKINGTGGKRLRIENYKISDTFLACMARCEQALTTQDISEKAVEERVEQIKKEKINPESSKTNFTYFCTEWERYRYSFEEGVKTGSLDLSNNQWGDSAEEPVPYIQNVEDLRKIGMFCSEHPNIHALNLKANKIGSAGAKVVSSYRFTALDLVYNQIDDEGAAALAFNPAIKHLDLSYNNLTGAGLMHFVTTKLETLKISGNQITSSDIKNYIEARTKHFTQIHERDNLKLTFSYETLEGSRMFKTHDFAINNPNMTVHTPAVDMSEPRLPPSPVILSNGIANLVVQHSIAIVVERDIGSIQWVSHEGIDVIISESGGATVICPMM